MFKFLILFLLYTSNLNAFEPSSGILCKNLKGNYSVEFLFKKEKSNKYINVLKRTDDKFREIGRVVGKKLSSFILFEDKTLFENIDFAWHLDEVTKNLKPFILSNIQNYKVKMPEQLSCISKNFWY